MGIRRAQNIGTKRSGENYQKVLFLPKTFTLVEIRFYKKDVKNGAYINWEDWRNSTSETDPSYDKTLIYEAVFQKKKLLSRKYKRINIAGEYYLGKQHPVALNFARFSYTLPLAKSDAASVNPPPKKD